MKFARKLMLGSAATAAMMVSNPALAQSNEAEIEALRAEVAALKAQLADLSAKVEKVAAAPVAPAAVAAPAPEKKIDTKPAPEISFKGAPEIKTTDGWSFKPRGRLLYDVASVSAPSAINDRGLGFSNEVRRARLGLEGTMPGGFGYKFELDFANGDAELTDGFLTYKDKGLTVTVGQHNSFQSLEELTSSNDTSFMERAAFTDAFGFERRIGLSLQYGKGPLLLQGGVFSDNVDDLASDENNSIGVDGRAVFAPKLGKGQLHLGGSYHWRSLGDAITSARYRQRPLVHSTDTRFVDTGSLALADSETSYGLEAAYINGRFHTAAEQQWIKLGRDGLPDASFNGGAVEAGIYLTNDSRSYRDGIFRGIKVRNPVGKGGLGALQFNVRYDWLDLNDGTIRGGKQNGYMASLIWNPIDYVRFMLNYARLDYSDAAISAAGDRDYGVDVIGARAQINF